MRWESPVNFAGAAPGSAAAAAAAAAAADAAAASAAAAAVVVRSRINMEHHVNLFGHDQVRIIRHSEQLCSLAAA